MAYAACLAAFDALASPAQAPGTSGPSLERGRAGAGPAACHSARTPGLATPGPGPAGAAAAAPDHVSAAAVTSEPAQGRTDATAAYWSPASWPKQAAATGGGRCCAGRGQEAATPRLQAPSERMHAAPPPSMPAPGHACPPAGSPAWRQANQQHRPAAVGTDTLPAGRTHAVLAPAAAQLNAQLNAQLHAQLNAQARPADAAAGRPAATAVAQCAAALMQRPAGHSAAQALCRRPAARPAGMPGYAGEHWPSSGDPRTPSSWPDENCPARANVGGGPGAPAQLQPAPVQGPGAAARRRLSCEQLAEQGAAKRARQLQAAPQPLEPQQTTCYSDSDSAASP